VMVLAMPSLADTESPVSVAIQLTPTGFLATCLCHLPSGDIQKWHVCEDSRLWQS
jgi:hypothetical protein